MDAAVPLPAPTDQTPTLGLSIEPCTRRPLG
jgi:hypothetical protein